MDPFEGRRGSSSKVSVVLLGRTTRNWPPRGTKSLREKIIWPFRSKVSGNGPQEDVQLPLWPPFACRADKKKAKALPIGNKTEGQWKGLSKIAGPFARRTESGKEGGFSRRAIRVLRDARRAGPAFGFSKLGLAIAPSNWELRKPTSRTGKG